ncbi:MAG: hypothetical protein JSV63_03030 [Candidatus Aenigmatarchaeota archaeon]|nr:MAG: hypothetical protein JSV63_03030 [Candidatus Aenigmarchaeota archaeon]
MFGGINRYIKRTIDSIFSRNAVYLYFGEYDGWKPVGKRPFTKMFSIRYKRYTVPNGSEYEDAFSTVLEIANALRRAGIYIDSDYEKDFLPEDLSTYEVGTFIQRLENKKASQEGPRKPNEDNGLEGNTV